MQSLRLNNPTFAIGLATIACALFLGSPDSAVAQNLPAPMQIKIFNNDPKYNIYPVLETGTAISDLWLRAWFKVPDSEKDDKPYPKLNNFRIYVNPTGTGIAPGKSITLVLPFLTQLVPTPQVDPKKTDQFIDWWGGGRVYIFAAPVADPPEDGKPPPELKTLYESKPGQTEIQLLPIGSVLPKCPACQQPLRIFKDTKGGFKNNAPMQLTEYALGAINRNNDPPTLDTFNGAVDIDVSYVDTIFLPAAMAPFNPQAAKLNQVGYVGTPQRIDTFRNALNKFIGPKSPYVGWPQFLTDATPRVKILKLASTLHATAGDPDLTKPPWAPISKLTTNWNNCLPVTKTDTICQDIRAVRALFQANYDNYKALYPQTKKCNPDIDPVKLTEDLMIAHVYGFTPFNENCTAERFNLLENTPGYDANDSEKFHQVKTTFDDLNYWKDGSFNPYVGLIHGAAYINAPNTYAYSVDDAVGNLQANGSGFIIAVGGTRGLPNANPASPPVNVNFGGSSAFGDWIRWGVCTTDPKKMSTVNPNFRSFAFYVQKENLSQCPISLQAKWKPGGEEVVYSFKLKTLDFTYEFDPKNPITDKTRAPIDCSGLAPIPAALCKDIYAYAEHNSGQGPDGRYAILPGVYPH